MLDDTELGQHRKHNTLQFEMVIDKELRILHECFNMEFNFCFVLVRREMLVQQVGLGHEHVNVTRKLLQVLHGSSWVLVG